MRWFSLALLICLSPLSALGDELRLVVTTSFQNAGLSDVLIPEIEADLGIEIALLVVGTGQALRLGEAGDVDAVLVHSPAAEKAFVAAGHATHRREIMHNEFVIVGPQNDPAGLRQAPSVAAAFQALASTQALFISRADDSGTHKRELMLWQLAGIGNRSPTWYREAGAGMGVTLNIAAGLGAHVLTDRGSWLGFGNKAGMEVLFAGDPELFNQYAYLPINPDRHTHVNFEAANRLEAWLASARGQALIGGHNIGGEALFTPNANP
jgi:tungstate transport system substrate-binding protein